MKLWLRELHLNEDILSGRHYFPLVPREIFAKSKRFDILYDVYGPGRTSNSNGVCVALQVVVIFELINKWPSFDFTRCFSNMLVSLTALPANISLAPILLSVVYSFY